jgi:hypothetical protein
LDIVNAWSVEDRAAVKAWAEIENGLADTPEIGHVRPAILGTAHVAADYTTSEAVPGDTFQSCPNVARGCSRTKPATTRARRSNRIRRARW